MGVLHGNDCAVLWAMLLRLLFEPDLLDLTTLPIHDVALYSLDKLPAADGKLTVTSFKCSSVDKTMKVSKPMKNNSNRNLCERTSKFFFRIVSSIKFPEDTLL